MASSHSRAVPSRRPRRGSLPHVDQPDPRVYFAAERTLLAWVRTGVTLIGLGFVVARFGLFLRIVNPTHPDSARMGHSSWVGVALSLGGGLVTVLAAVQFL